jgi:hypothetical protein
MTMSGKNPSGLPVELSGHAWVWRRAVILQVERINSPLARGDRFVDAYLLAIAIRQVHACALAMNKGVQGTDQILRSATAEFLKDHPSAKDARDVLIHFDEYQVGEGRLQKEGEMGPLDITIQLSDASTMWLVLGDRVRIELSSAAYAAVQLADEVLNSEARYRSANRQRGTFRTN